MIEYAQDGLRFLAWAFVFLGVLSLGSELWFIVKAWIERR